MSQTADFEPKDKLAVSGAHVVGAMLQPQTIEPSNPSSQINRRGRTRLSKGQKRLIAEYLDDKFCHKCAICGETEMLERHHINDDPSDNRLANFRWLCKPCNLSQRGRNDSARLSVSVRSEGVVEPSDNLVSASAAIQDRVIYWLMRRLGPAGPSKLLPLAMILKEASWDCHVSPITLRRYLDNPGPLTASNAPFRLIRIQDPSHDRPGQYSKAIIYRGTKLSDIAKMELMVQ